MKKKEKPGAQFRTVENKRLISALYILLRISVVTLPRCSTETLKT